MIARNQGRGAMLALALLFAGMIFGICRNCWHDFWISLDAAQTKATIITERSHGVYDYQYLVNGIQYVGHGQRGGNLDRNAHLGGQTFVYFSSSHPWLSSLEMPTALPWIPLASIALFLYLEFFAVKYLINSRYQTQPVSKSQA